MQGPQWMSRNRRIWNDCAAEQVRHKITNDENRPHKLKPLIVPAQRLFKWLFDFNHHSAFVHNGNFFESSSLGLLKKEREREEEVRRRRRRSSGFFFLFFFLFLQSDESINYAFRIPGSRKQHVYLSSYQSFPPFTRCQRARRDTNTGRGWVGGRTAELVVMEKISISSFIRRGRAPAELGLICVQLSALWGTLGGKFVSPCRSQTG